MGLPPHTPHESAPPPAPTTPEVDDAAGFRALADPARLRILAHLRACGAVGGGGAEVCACDLEGVAGVSQSTVSHHMKRLAAAGLVRAQKRGRWTYYRVDRAALHRLRTTLAYLEGR